MVNYDRELRMGVNVRKRGKMEKMTKFVERMNKVQEKAEATLKKAQEEIKQLADRGRKETKVWKVGNKVILSTKNLIFKKQPAKKLVDQYVGLYTINKVISTNAIKLQLPTSMRIHPVVNVS